MLTTRYLSSLLLGTLVMSAQPGSQLEFEVTTAAFGYPTVAVRAPNRGRYDRAQRIA
jgi:hypothetical protein